ncbi:ABC transporter ATP-binding/permease protein YojI [Kordia sp. SMS9]|uniref:cyclic peptide export ABC transporter n=1 Tax=Kordia sp. SMS9 TaxID=2282170 RepID=UPI000E0CE21B|nr:cyclic peptide export ABC transporter [Kordia sp. SMS9]AXG70230.1 ABC transporter ATP-binding/permease protein YojI [Kordia sp. SMS9]
MIKISKKSIILYSVLGIISGLSSFFFIALTNSVINLSIANRMPKEHNYLLYFSITIVLFFVIRRLLSEGIIELSQKLFWDIRKSITKSILKAPYLKVFLLKDEIYAALTSDVGSITNASLVIVRLVTSIILVLTCFIYMYDLSPVYFLISLGCIFLGILIYFRNSKTSNKDFKRVRNLEQDFMRVFNSVLHGNKEIKVNPQKGDDLYEWALSPIVIEGEQRNKKALVGYLNSQLVSQILFYIIIVVILIISGNYFDISLGIQVSFVFALLYLLGPIVNIMLSIPTLNVAYISLRKLKKLKEKLQYDESEVNLPKLLENDEEFKKIEFIGYQYQYEDNSFSLGPIDFSITAGEIIFIYGGNGSGKTTFINTLLSLYTPNAGSIVLNEKLIDQNPKSIRQLFTPVFNDFYLFDAFYGIENIDTEKIQMLLELFELDKKVTLKDNKFSSTNLSTGQRKRLALITAIIEDRPILVLDEWAADQDPEFRKKFYTEIIHWIVKHERKTIFAITHDDNYYNEADRLFQMNYGTLNQVSTQKKITKK